MYWLEEFDEPAARWESDHNQGLQERKLKPLNQLLYIAVITFILKYSQTSVARTYLGL